MVDLSDVVGLAGKTNEIVATELVVVVGHGIHKAPDDRFSYVCGQSASGTRYFTGDSSHLCSLAASIEHIW